MIAVYTMVGTWYGINGCVDYTEEHGKKGRVFKGLEFHFGYTSRYPKSSSDYREYAVHYCPGSTKDEYFRIMLSYPLHVTIIGISLRNTQ